MSLRFLTATLGFLILAGCNAPQTTTATAPENSGTENNEATTPATVTARPGDATGAFVRGIHVVPGAGAMELREGDNSAENSLVQGVTFGNVSSFVEVPLADNKSTKLEISAYGAGNTHVSGPMPVTVSGGEDLSVVINGVPGDIALMPFKHKNHGSAAGKAKITVLHAAKGLPPIDIEIDGKSFRKSVKYGVATDYETMSPGKHTMKVDYTETTSAEKIPTPIPEVGTAPMPEVMVKQRQHVALTQDLDLVAGQVYSVTVYYDENHLPRLTLAQDKFVPTLKNAPKK